ncbi:MAG: hypothetical protein ACYTFO_02065, partial [Planctomycetota bacterium]
MKSMSCVACIAGALLCIGSGCEPAPEEFFSRAELRAYLNDRIPILISEDDRYRGYMPTTIIRHHVASP